MDEPIAAKPLLTAMEIRAYIDGLEEEVKVVSKKAADQKKRLLKAQRHS